MNSVEIIVTPPPSLETSLETSELFQFFKNEENLSQALIDIRKPTLLLKYGSSGTPHFRNFYVSQNFDKLFWVSSKKSSAEIDFRDVVKILKGRQTEKFRKYKSERTEYESLSFSIIYLENLRSSKKNKFETQSLDITCKDLKEFDLWFNGIKVCSYAAKSKIDLIQLENKFLDNNQQIGEGLEKDTFKFKSLKDLVREADDIKSLFFWGNNSYLQCGVSSSLDKLLDPTELVLMNKNDDPISIALGYNHSLVLLSNGDLFSFGCALNGRLGIDDYDFTCNISSFPPTNISLFSLKVKSISCGDFHSAVVDEHGSLFVWGSNYYGQLGIPFFQEKNLPEKVLNLYNNELKNMKILSTHCGPNYTLILTRESSVYATGHNRFNTLNLSQNILNYTQFEKIKSPNSVGGIACGGYHVLAYDKNRKTLYSWGWGAMGQLGAGDDTGEGVKKVMEMAEGEEILQIEAGMVHSALLVKRKENTLVYSWGGNNHGQLGNGMNENSSLPKVVEILSEENVVQIACGMFHMGAITKNGQVFMWGDGSNGTLGNGTTSGSRIPINSKNEDFLSYSVSFLACGGTHTGVIAKRSIEFRKQANECKLCKVRLDTIFRRKCYCRNCGELFCNNCSSKKIALIKLGFIDPVKVCDVCYNNLTLN